MATPFQLRPYRSEDEDAAITLWLETWQQAYPAIDFGARVSWWRERWRGELVPNAAIVVAEQDGALTGFVTIDRSGYLDQLVVAPAHWGSELAAALVDAAKRLSPRWHHAAGQHRQRQSHPLLPTQWFCAGRRRRQSNLGKACPEDGVAAVTTKQIDIAKPITAAARLGKPFYREAEHARAAISHTPSNCSLASRA